jgi:hypothetical protein
VAVLTRRRYPDRSHCWHVYFGDVRLDIDPSFENHSDMVLAPPGQLASADRSKVVERDEKIYRKKPEFIRIHSGAGFGDVVSDARMHFSSPAEE